MFFTHEFPLIGRAKGAAWQVLHQAELTKNACVHRTDELKLYTVFLKNTADGDQPAEFRQRLIDCQIHRSAIISRLVACLEGCQAALVDASGNKMTIDGTDSLHFLLGRYYELRQTHEHFEAAEYMKEAFRQTGSCYSIIETGKD